MEEMEKMKRRAEKAIETFLDGYFYEEQKRLGIMYGDVCWDQQFTLDERIENLADIVATILYWQAEAWE